MRPRADRKNDVRKALPTASKATGVPVHISAVRAGSRNAAVSAAVLRAPAHLAPLASWREQTEFQYKFSRKAAKAQRTGAGCPPATAAQDAGGTRHAPSGRRGFTLTEILAVMAILSLMVVSLFTMFQQGSGVWRLSGARTEAYMKARQILDMMARDIRGAVLITAAGGPKAEPDLNLKTTKRADFVGLNGDNEGLGVNQPTLQDWRTREQEFSDQIYFVAPVTNSGKQELCMLGYWIKDVDGNTSAPFVPDGVPGNSRDDVLVRSYRTDNNGQPDDVWKKFDFSDQSFSPAAWDATGGEVALSVRQLDIKYCDYESSGGTTRLREYNAWDSLPSKDGGTTSAKDDDNRLPAAVKITITVGDKDDILKGIKLSTIVHLDNASRATKSN